MAYVVDGEVGTIGGEPSLYKIHKVHERVVIIGHKEPLAHMSQSFCGAQFSGLGHRLHL